MVNLMKGGERGCIDALINEHGKIEILKHIIHELLTKGELGMELSNIDISIYLLLLSHID